MSDKYTNQVLKIVVAQICQTIGFTSVQSTPMEVMTDVLHHYIEEICKLTKDYAELYNRTEPNLTDIELAYKDMKINLSDLKEYMEFVDPIACPIQVPKYPLPKESHLNFLKPGSQEVITRPTHIPEYLPPMQPPEEEEPTPMVVATEEVTAEEMQVNEEPSPAFFKKPEAVPSDAFRKIKFEEEGKPTREISSVMMTTGGFISPAREGKLPDSKVPVIVPDKRPSPPPAPPPVVAAPLPVTSIDNKFEEKPKKKHEEKKQKKPPKKELLSSPIASSSSTPMATISKTLPPIPPHSIASSVPPSLPPIVKPMTPVTPRKPGRPPKIRPDGTPTPPKPKKPRDPDAKILRQLKKQIAAGALPPLPKEKLLILSTLKNQIAAGKLPAMPEHQLMEMVKNYKPPQPHATTPSVQPFAPPQFGMPPKIEGKLPTEPEKSKLTFFKKIGSTPKATAAHHQIPHSLDFLSQQTQPKMEIPDEHTPPMMKKRERESFDTSSFGRSPMELTLPKTPDFMPRTPDVKTAPWVKEEKKKKEKPIKKPKKQKIPTQPPPMMPFNLQALGAMGGMGLPFAHQARFPFFPNLLTTGPGLIPNNPFMPGPSFGGGPFGLMPGMGGGPPGLPGPSNMFQNLAGISPRMREDLHPTIPIVEKTPIMPAEKPQHMAHVLSTPSVDVSVKPLQMHQQQISPLPPQLQHLPAQIEPATMIKLPPDTIAIPVPEKPVEAPQAPPPPPADAATGLTAEIDFDTIDLTSPVSAKSDKKKDKEHKKEKKDKDGKLKKKKKQKDKDREKGEKPEKEKSKKHKKEKKKDKERLEAHKLLSSNTDSVDASDSSMASVPKLTLKLGIAGGSRSSTPDVPKKIPSIKAGSSKKKDSDSFSDTFSDIGSSPRANLARESSPELAKISALVTHPPKKRPHSPKKKKHEDEHESEKMKSPTKHKKHSTPPTSVPGPSSGDRRPPHEEEGQKVWICPACAQIDNGTPMIGCDGCDAWYHWVCVGIQVPPDVNEDWYCRACISRKQESQGGEKKKKRKKNKEKPEKL